jgi:hypothetical protein
VWSIHGARDSGLAIVNIAFLLNFQTLTAGEISLCVTEKLSGEFMPRRVTGCRQNGQSCTPEVCDKA